MFDLLSIDFLFNLFIWAEGGGGQVFQVFWHSGRNMSWGVQSGKKPQLADLLRLAEF